MMNECINIAKVDYVASPNGWDTNAKKEKKIALNREQNGKMISNERQQINKEAKSKAGKK